MPTQSVKRFQAERGLKPDGEVGALTWQAIENAVYFPSRPPFRSLTEGEKKAKFGDPKLAMPLTDGRFHPNRDWARNNLVRVSKAALLLPEGTGPAGLPHLIELHRLCADPFLALWRAWAR